MTKCVNAKYRIGLTGMLDGTKTHKLVLEGLFGTKIISDSPIACDFSMWNQPNYVIYILKEVFVLGHEQI